ncbi:MAG TPA: hypothetical protein VFS56_07280, partial [Gemmatimonadaceae bacterium]|nr:hypothetical protein [Gemmatimonadaceae bacterium]
MLTARELESRLLDYTRTKLVTPETRHTVTGDTRLFEERVIDSLRILELIAFLEAQLGRKVPDAQVVLANFRTIKVMATVFAGDAAPAVTPRRQSRNRAGISVRRSSSHAEPVAELIHRGEIEVLEGGEIRF